MEYTKYVTSNYSEKGINSVLDDIGVSAGKDLNIVEEVYNTALHALKAAGNEVTEIAIVLASSSKSKLLSQYKCILFYIIIIIILSYSILYILPHQLFFSIARLSFVSFIVASLV